MPIRNRIAIFAGCFAIISMAPSIHAQTIGEYGGVLGRSASGPRMPAIDPSRGIRVDDHTDSSAHSAPSRSRGDEEVRASDDDDNAKDSPKDRNADWEQVK